jgi:fatty acid synthase subunit alpha
LLTSSGQEVVDKPPVYRDVALPTAPHTEVTPNGDILYSEILRQNVRKLESYVKGEHQVSTLLTGRDGIWW